MSSKTASGAQGERQVTVPLHDNLDSYITAHVSSPEPAGLDGQAPSASATGQRGGGVQDAVAQVLGSARARVPSTGEQPEPGQQGRGDQGSGLPRLTGKCLQLAARQNPNPILPGQRNSFRNMNARGQSQKNGPRLRSTREELGSAQPPWDG